MVIIDPGTVVYIKAIVVGSTSEQTGTAVKTRYRVKLKDAQYSDYEPYEDQVFIDSEDISFMQKGVI